MADGKEEGVDVLKFFIGVMTLLTLFIAGYAGFTWSQVSLLEEQVDADQHALDQLVTLGADPDFRMALARDRQQKLNVTVNTSDLQRFLIDSTAQLGFTLKTIDPVGNGGSGLGLSYVKKAYKLSIEKKSLEVIADYLYYIQTTWPGGLKVEELLVHPAPKPNKDAEWQGWNAEVLVSTYRPKDQPAP